MKEREYDKRAALRAEGRAVMGVKRILAQPRAKRSYRREIRKGIRPHVPASDAVARIEALRRLKVFSREHERARIQDLAGKDTFYPAGRYRARLLGRPCALSP